ncbi:LOB domain-containing protein 27-like [Durio zibethinus]|uniref:LOB domain-containing protein 27-like n=1 Tax=Durio zibethinus TaxID=66656 RepID=A0A6P5XUL8_DURZI|nr:LOB domain-containing protein 27-like [Durio zibethinus]
MNGGGGGADLHACSICEHRRKRCDNRCELPHYYDMGNRVRIMDSDEPHQRQADAESILIEGNARLNHSVLGRIGVIRSRRSLVGFYESELQAVNQQLAFFKRKQQQKQQLDNSIASSSSTVSPPSESVNDQGGGLNLEDDANLKFFDTHPSDQIMDLKQNGNEITSASSDTKGKQPGEPDEETKNDGTC